jgi:uncharacterized protein with ParB-like and HNH nuclease domain
MPKKEPETLDLENEVEQADEVLVEYDIAAYPSDLTLEVLYKMWGDGNKDITIPGFQRGFVWTIKQASRLIESFLIGLPVPPVFFYIDPQNKNLVVDGQQRILSIVYFYEGYFGVENSKGRRQIFKLTGLNPKSAFYNKKYTDLNEVEKRKLNGSVLRAINIRQLSPKEENTSVYHIFERLNTGGTPLASQEIRNVVFRGGFVNKLKNLNNNAHWRNILGKKTPDKHLKDVELIIRIFGLAYHLNLYEKPMHEFLNKMAKRYQDGKNKTVVNFSGDFAKVCSIINENFRKRPFNLRGPMNASALDAVFAVLLNNIKSLPKNLSERYEKLFSDPEFANYTSLATTDVNTIKQRISLVKKRLID